MGRKQAFASLAGGCSAADAECLRQMREQRKYRALGLTWAEFCKRRQAEPEVGKNEAGKDETEDQDRAIEKAERLLRAAVNEIGRVEEMPLDAIRRQQLFTRLSAQIRRLRMVHEVSVRLGT